MSTTHLFSWQPAAEANAPVHFVSKTSNWHCTQVTSPATPVPGSHIVGSFDLSFTGEMQGKAHCTLVMTAYGKQLANGHKPNDFGESERALPSLSFTSLLSICRFIPFSHNTLDASFGRPDDRGQSSCIHCAEKRSGGRSFFAPTTLADNPAGQAYFTGKLGGAEGSIAINQVGIFDGKRMVSTWTFLPETGTGQLEGLTGTTELEGSDPTPGAFEGAVEATFA